MKRKIVDILSALVVVMTLALVTAVQTAMPVQAASSGPNSGSTAGDDSSIGTIAWSIPSNALTQDDTYAAAGLTKVNQISHYLKVTGFGFSIPSSATIKGIAVEVDRFASTGTGGTRVSDNGIRLVKGGAISGDNKASPSLWPNSDTDTYVSYGSSIDLWGLTWTPADINDSGFGVAISARKDESNNTRTAHVDHIRITVYYNQAPVANPQSGLSIDSCSALTVILSGSDPDNDPLTYVIATLPTQGDLYDGEGTGGTHITSVPYSVTDTSHRVTYQPKAMYSGDDSFGFKVNDATVDSAEATVSITVSDGRSTWYEDSDNDTYGNPNVSALACDQPVGYVSDNADCDDNDASVNPGAIEVPYNGKDDDCNPATPDAVYELTMAADPEAGGTATDLTNESPYAEDVEVSIKAQANEGYQFVNWTATVGIFGNATAAETIFTMPAQNVTVTALFELVSPPPMYPTVTTQAATNITDDSATMHMSYTMGDFSLVEVRFAYKKSADSAWAYTAWVTRTADGTYSEVLTDLNTNTKYEFTAQLKYNPTVESTIHQFTTATPSTPPPSGGGGCFIATAAYGTPTAKQIDVLREFRDDVLLKSTAGSEFVALYYQFSPPIANVIASNELLRTVVRELLIHPIVWVIEATGNMWRN